MCVCVYVEADTPIQTRRKRARQDQLECSTVSPSVSCILMLSHLTITCIVSSLTLFILIFSTLYMHSSLCSLFCSHCECTFFYSSFSSSTLSPSSFSFEQSHISVSLLSYFLSLPVLSIPAWGISAAPRDQDHIIRWAKEMVGWWLGPRDKTKTGSHKMYTL